MFIPAFLRICNWAAGVAFPIPTLPSLVILNFSVKVELLAPPVNVPTTKAPAALLPASFIALNTTLGLEPPEPPKVFKPVPAPSQS